MKPDCIGQKFGRLLVLGKSANRSKHNKQLWILKCDCGNIAERERQSFDRKSTNCPSCGCYNKERIIAERLKTVKPDCTGERFGRLVVLGKGGKIPDRNSYRQLWKLQCDCGAIIEKPRSDFEDNGQKSCGCARSLGLVDNKRRPINILNQRFGNLVAVGLTGKKDKYKQPTWKLRCDCGKTCEMSHKTLNRKQNYCLWINCGDRANHPEIYCWYPATPSPYPPEAGELLEKYLYLTELGYQKIDCAIEDEMRDRLLRAAWIVVYRRQQGEEMSELHEKRFISKWIRHSVDAVRVGRALERFAPLRYNSANIDTIGSTMTNVTSNNYPEIKFQGKNLVSIKRLKFRRR